MSVLVGHQGPVTYVDFNRTVPNVLLSSSFDGTCRIWDATNSAWPAKVMRACPSFGPMKGITRFGGLSGPFNPGQTSKPNTRSLQEPATARGMPADAANAPIEQRLRSSDPPEAAAAGADAAVNDQVRFPHGFRSCISSTVVPAMQHVINIDSICTAIAALCQPHCQLACTFLVHYAPAQSCDDV